MKRLLALMVLMTATVFTGATQITSAQASKPAGDPRVKAALDKHGFKYEIDEDGDFKLGMKLPDGRTQLAWIRSTTEQVGGSEIREILSPGYKAKGTLSAAVANQLLTDSANKKLGAWQVFKNQDTSLAVFCSKVAANTSPDNLLASLQLTLRSADGMEKTLSGKDDF
mgnify:CR=1 FL=1